MPRDEKVLLVGTGLTERDELVRELDRNGYRPTRASTGAEALRLLGRGPYAAVVSEWDLPDLRDGVLLRRVGHRYPGTALVAVGSSLSHGQRQEMMRGGVDEYLETPPDPNRIVASLTASLMRRGTLPGNSLIGRSERMREIIATISQIAPTKVTVLIAGESGTGKELVARAIHDRSPRRENPFIAVNCGALPPGVLESELFGHERGAFTGAVGERKGRFELAHKGTLFLDEVGELPPATQVELLRVLEEEKFVRVGGAEEIEVDVRIVAATNRDLERLVREGEFREDLYYRLRVVTIRLPPLRERPEDIPLLAHHFLENSAERHGLPAPHLSPGALRSLAGMAWPGNVRELRNLLDSLVVLKRGEEIGIEDLPTHAQVGTSTSNLPLPLNTTREAAERELIYQSLLALRAEITEVRNLLLRHLPTPETDGGGGWGTATVEDPGGGKIAPAPLRLEELEREAVRAALDYTGGNRKEAAKILGIGLRTLYRKLRRYDLG